VIFIIKRGTQTTTKLVVPDVLLKERRKILSMYSKS